MRFAARAAGASEPHQFAEAACGQMRPAPRRRASGRPRCRPRSPARSWPRRRSRRRAHPWCDRAGRSTSPSACTKALASALVLRRQRHRGGKAARDVVGKTRSRQDRRDRMGARFGDHLGHEFVACRARCPWRRRSPALPSRGAAPARLTASRKFCAGVAIRMMSARAASAMSLVTSTLASSADARQFRILARRLRSQPRSPHCARRESHRVRPARRRRPAPSPRRLRRSPRRI